MWLILDLPRGKLVKLEAGAREGSLTRSRRWASYPGSGADRQMRPQEGGLANDMSSLCRRIPYPRSYSRLQDSMSGTGADDRRSAYSYVSIVYPDRGVHLDIVYPDSPVVFDDPIAIPTNLTPHNPDSDNSLV